MHRSHRRARRALSVLVLAAAIPFATAAEPAEGPFLIEGLALHDNTLAFAASGRIWLAPAEGGLARPLTDGRHRDIDPVFSPDGVHVAFCRTDSGFGDVFATPTAGGRAQRLTWHPERDRPVAWTPDGREILFASNRGGFREQLYAIAVDGVHPRMAPLPHGSGGAYAADGARLAYTPHAVSRTWRFYRGGLMAAIHIAELPAGDVRPFVEGDYNAHSPIWLGDTIYYIADRGGIANLYARNAKTGAARQLTRFRSFGVRYAAASGARLAFERDGQLYLMDLTTDRYQPIPLQIPLDFKLRRERRVNALRWADEFRLSAAGEAATVTARGEVFRVETATGKARNLTQTGGVAERGGVLSPTGGRLAYFSDESGEYQLHLRELANGETQRIDIEPQPGFYQELVWSPDGRRLCFSDHRLGLWRYDLGADRPVEVARAADSGQNRFNPAWSPDGRYLAFELRGANRLPAITIHDAVDGKNRRIAGGDVHASNPVFDAGGRYLYFISSPNAGAADFKWSVLNGVHSQSRVIGHLNAVVLRAGDGPPVLPAARQPNLDIDWETPAATPIDFDGVASRIAPIRLETRNVAALAPAWPGALYLSVRAWPEAPVLGAQPRLQLHILDLRNPTKLDKLAHAILDIAVSADGKTALYQTARSNGPTLLTWQDSRDQHRNLPMSALPMKLDSLREWRQIYHEAWRYMREHLYDPSHHGQSLQRLGEHYARYLPNITDRADLNRLIQRLYGHISVSHIRVGGGDLGRSRRQRENVGLLGATFERTEQGFRFKKILRAPHYDQRRHGVHAPLDQLGARVEAGEYLLAIDDKPVNPTRNIYRQLLGKANTQVRLLVGPNPDGSQAREIRAFTIDDEQELGVANWAAENRRKVDELSGGKLAYVHIDGYNPAGLEDFLRDYHGGQDKRGLLIDQRFNGGGITPDALIELLSRKPLYAYLFRNGADLPTPVNAFDGPKALLINQWNGSAAETFALMFRLGEIGPIVGKATVGAGIGPYGYQWRLADGGRIQVPNRGAYDPAGNWGIENMGVKPHIEVEIDPRSWREGRDPQLERAVSTLLEELETYRRKKYRHPKFPNHPFQWDRTGGDRPGGLDAGDNGGGRPER